MKTEGRADAERNSGCPAWRRPAAPIVAVALLALGMTARAQTGEGSMQAEGEDLVALDAISVTATRTGIPAFEYPGMVTVIGRDEIRRRQPSTPDDVLRDVPGVEFTGGPRRTGEVPSIRGFSGPDVVITLDGARQNFLSGHDGRFFVDPSLLREVEVLRGSASALYGSGGTGGVLELRTVRAGDLLAADQTVGATLTGSYRSVNEERRGTATVYGRPGAGVDLLGSVTRRASGDIQLGGGGELDRTDDEITSGLAKAGWAPSPHQRLELSLLRFDNDAEEPNNGQGAGSDDVVDKDIRSDTARLGWTLDDPARAWLDLEATLYGTRTSVDEVRLDDSGLGPAGERLEREVDTIGLRIENSARLLEGARRGLTLTYGVEGYRDDQEGQANGAERGGVPDAETEFGGVFGQAELRLAAPAGLPGTLLLVPGLRYDHYQASSDIAADNDDRELSPRFGVSYLPSEWSLLFASYGAGFRAPTVGELYQSGEHFRIPVGSGVTNRFVPNPDLDPQRTETYELGFGFDFRDLLAERDRLELKASRFFIDGDDFIDSVVDQPEPFVDCNPFLPGDCDGTTRAENVSDAELDGFEVAALYRSDRWRVSAAVSAIDGEDEDTGEKLGVLTPTQLSTDLAYRLPAGNVTLGWRMLAAERFDEVNDPAEERAGYAVHDLYLSWAPQGGGWRGWRLDLGVDNVADKAYERVFTGAKEPGRNYKVTVSYAFGR